MMLLLLIALPLALKHLMLLIFGSNRGKSLKGKLKSSYTRWGLPFNYMEFQAKSCYRALVSLIVVRNLYFFLFPSEGSWAERGKDRTWGTLWIKPYVSISNKTCSCVQLCGIRSCFQFNHIEELILYLAPFTGMLSGHRIKLELKGWALKFPTLCVQVLLFHAYPL
jgi:hypothetical protein